MADKVDVDVVVGQDSVGVGVHPATLLGECRVVGLLAVPGALGPAVHLDDTLAVLVIGAEIVAVGIIKTT